MCVNFDPADRAGILRLFARWNLTVPAFEVPKETWQDRLAPIVVHPDECEMYCTIASFGMVPQRYKPPKVKTLTTMNARAETLGERRNFKPFWDTGQLALVPITGFYEPFYETREGPSTRWRIGMANGSPFAVAGLWRTWIGAEGEVERSFTQITVNADDHPLMKRFHKWDDVKRSLVIVAPDDYEVWLTCRDPDLARTFLKLYPAELMTAAPAPLPPRKKKAVL
ncbi:SOS response-associated peptidase family protein [Chitinivorax sp. PXF-14]|uniref:SOS response-associated peptidase n=1 Tax=Chitinivorax sp. PXF-14 TaxID=3230488 RepID=UPI003465E79B